ncbi:GntR family transcriptional regulator [Halalkalibacter urbisdiaboli]|uniref:GntR family transcriptional regulator n=1 Tax=Halalkalibacter urbisdiaboli TaxID=1960589 RepID=UPI000B442DAA|nr:GntR family transcriptional regulator [Halalkalibacter urbisdiaboli]
MQTKYNMVKQAIKSKILDGSIVPHQKISSENELMKQFSVSRHTTRKAIGELVNEGWLYRSQGAGTFCADRQHEEESNKPTDTKRIAIITTYISDYIFPTIIRGAESHFSEHGYQVSVFSTNNDVDKEKSFLESILSQQFDGIIIEPTRSANSTANLNYFFNLERLNIPYIMINAFYDELDPICLIMDDEKGGYIQTEHLLKLGHKKILGFFKTDDIQGKKRLKGYVNAHRQFGVPIDSNNIITYNTEEKKTKPVEELRERLGHSFDRPTALISYNDQLALTLLDVLRDHDMKIPTEMSIVGYDDSFLAQASEVKLTTIKHPKHEMGQMAAKMIMKLIQEKQSSHSRKEKVESIIYEPELVIRNSTSTVEQCE